MTGQYGSQPPDWRRRKGLALNSGGMSADLAQDIVSLLCPPATGETPLDVSLCADVAPIGG